MKCFLESIMFALVVLLTSFGVLHVGSSVTICSDLVYSSSNTSDALLDSLNSIVDFAERNIKEQQVKKEQLVRAMLVGENRSVALSQERTTKERQADDLSSNISRLQTVISNTVVQRRALQTYIANTEEIISTTSAAITASSSRIASLQVLIKAHEDQIAYMNRRIAEESRKRGCGIFGRRRRRVRRGWRVRRSFRKIGRGIRKVGRTLKKVIKLPVCLVRSVISRLKRTKKKLQRKRDGFANNLRRVQHEKRINDAQMSRLQVRRATSMIQLRDLEKELARMNKQLLADKTEKIKTDKELTSLRARIVELTESLRYMEKRLLSIREQKSDVLDTIGVLKIEVSKKMGYVEDLESADDDVIHDIVEEIADLNNKIEAAVNKLHKLLCETGQ